MSKIGDNIKTWEKMAEAIESRKWDKVEKYLDSLLDNLKDMKTAIGVYAIGFQRTYHAPENIKTKMKLFNDQVFAIHKKENNKKKKKKGK